MNEGSFINEYKKECGKGITANRSAMLCFRWFTVASVVLLYFFVSGSSSRNFAFLETVAVLFIYNILFTAKALKNDRLYRKVPLVIPVIDIIFSSIINCFLGGLNSDIWVVYFFIIGFYGIYGSLSKTLKISLICIMFYSASCIYTAHINMEQFNIIRLFFKDSFILFAGFGISMVGFEVRKFNEMHKREFKLARLDKLTGLANRHYMDHKIEEEVEYADCYKKPLNILIFDLDRFKSFNDTYGHVWGDKLLTLFADIVMQGIRENDIPVRFGGEEFLIIIRDLDIEIARSVGERIRRKLEKQKIYVEDSETRTAVTVSCGIAQYPTHSASIKEVIECADKALYHAKETGRNKVVTYDDIPAAK